MVGNEPARRRVDARRRYRYGTANNVPVRMRGSLERFYPPRGGLA